MEDTIPMQNRKLHLLLLSPGQCPFDWPSLHAVWIHIHGIPYHCRSSNILLSLASSIGSPLKLDYITASKTLLNYARILINLVLSKPKPIEIKVELEGDSEALLSASYENLPCSNCLSPGHSENFCNSGPTVTKATTFNTSTQLSQGILSKPPNLPPTS